MAELNKKPCVIKLEPGEHIAAVVPEYASGPGWSNQLAWVHIHNNGTRTFRTEAIQILDGEGTDRLMALFRPGAAMVEALIDAVPTKKARPA